MIDVRDLTFAYPGQSPIFAGFNWHVDPDEAWAVVGASGSGKSTLLYLLAGLLRPDSGEVQLGGMPLTRPRPRTGLILQDYGLLPWATVQENAGLGLRVRRFYGPDGRHAPAGKPTRPLDSAREVDHWLERLGIAELRDQYPSQISGGQRQRTAIARTLAMNPDLLLMDEPFSSLDTLTRERLERVTLELRAEAGLTTVVVTHNIEEAAYLGRHILVLRRPPHEEATVISNPDGGALDFRSNAAFQARCSQIRELLEETPDARA